MNKYVRYWFTEVLAVPLEKRSRWLSDHCPEESIRAEVLSLLCHDHESDSALLRPVHRATAQFDPSRCFERGARLGPFELGDRLGHGGMGCVFEAHRVDGQGKETVAIKILDVPAGDEQSLQALAERFLRERRIWVTLQHPYIAALLDAGTACGVPYFVMERIDGLPIDQFATNRELTSRECVKLVLKVSEAVELAHQKRIVHRDIKPTNILVTADGTPKLLDFGIAGELLHTAEAQTGPSALTPEYASPEQVAGGAVTVATDVYGLGGVLYRLLTGRPPHSMERSSLVDFLRVVLEVDVLPAGRLRPSLRGELEGILCKALQRDPHQRYASVQAFADDLRSF